MKKILIGVGGVVIILVVGFFAVNSFIYNEKQADTSQDSQDYKDIAYMIEGESVSIKKDKGSTFISLGGALTYFGNELVTDLNDDGRDDRVFLVTYEPGGSGTFFYVVAALNTESGYVGSDGYLLGDRIAPQTTELSQNPRHKNVVVVNYADRAEGDAMTTAPSLGKSVYLKLDPEYMQWGIVVPDFEGESR